MITVEIFDLKIKNVDYEMVRKSFAGIVYGNSSLPGDVWSDDKTEYNGTCSDKELNDFLEEIGCGRVFEE